MAHVKSCSEISYNISKFAIVVVL